MRLPCVEIWVHSYVDHRVLKTDGGKLFKDLLTNKIVSKQSLS